MRWVWFSLFWVIISISIFLALKTYGYEIKGDLSVTGKATLMYKAEMDNSDTSLLTADAQIPSKKYVDWKAGLAGSGSGWVGSYPIINADVSSSAEIAGSKLNLSGLTWDDFN